MAAGIRSAPRYQQVADALRRQIGDGALADGAPLPTESALCVEHQVSRFTVREALKRLQMEGLVRRRRGSGTVVDRGGGHGLRQSLSDLAELLQYAAGSSFDFKALGEVTLGTALAEALGVRPNSRWIHLAGLRTMAGEATPIAATDVYINHLHAAHVPRLAPGNETLFRQLERLAGVRVARVEQSISAIAAGARETATLRVARRAPCLRIVRAYHDLTGEPIEISSSVHPGELFTYSMHIDH